MPSTLTAYLSHLSEHYIGQPGNNARNKSHDDQACNHNYYKGESTRVDDLYGRVGTQALEIKEIVAERWGDIPYTESSLEHYVVPNRIESLRYDDRENNRKDKQDDTQRIYKASKN